MRTFAIVTSLAMFLGASAAHAQDQVGSIALNQFDPAAAGDTFFSIPSPHVVGDPVEVRAGLVFDAARNPLNLLDNATEATVVATQTFMHLNASIGILDRVMIGLMLPVALVQSGDDPTLQGTEVASPDGTQVGDLRVDARIRFYGEYEDPFQIGTGMYLFTPTGPAGSFVAEDGVRITPYVAMGGRFFGGIGWAWNVSVGPEIRGEDFGSRMKYGVGFAGVLFDTVQIGPEFFASTPVQETDFRLTQTERIETADSTNVELLVGTRVRLWHFVAGAAGGPGLTKAIGTPSFRLVGSFSYDPEPEQVDSGTLDDDGDGINNDQDQCPFAYGEFASGTQRHGCPSLDDDEDGIPNHEDACPNTYGAPSDNPEENGCRATASLTRPRF